MKFVSYAQNQEDVLLWRVLSKVKNGFYVDVGAYHPIFDSVTKAFYDKGWSGINIEPQPESFHFLEEDRDRDVNLNVGVSDAEGQLDFYEFYAESGEIGLSTFERAIAEEHMSSAQGFTCHEKKVPVRALTSILDEYVANGQVIHFMKIDVEGFEAQVLKGLSFQLYKPWVVLVEATYPNSKEQTHEEWERFLTSSGYQFVFFDGLNRYYVDHEHSDFKKEMSYPVTVLDNFESYHISEIYRKNETLLHENKALNAELSSIYNSLSWRITAWLRWLNKFVKRK